MREMSWLPLLPGLFLGACSPERSGSTEAPALSSAPAVSVAPEARWLLEQPGEERFVRIARQLRGLDVAMAEIGYRYGELHWASRDRNWGYAAYQLAKIEIAMANGVERRPKRAASARMLEVPAAAIRNAITSRDGAALDTAMVSLMTSCNACHRAEQVPFIRIEPPTLRGSVVHAPEGAP
jgi:hypothetical protein